VSGILIVIFLVLLILVVVALATMVRVLQEYERAVIFRLGNVLRAPKGPGLFLILPFGIDRMRKVNLQTVAMNVPPQDVITRDNMMVRVDAVVYLRVVDPVKAVVEIQNYLFATSQAAQTNLRVILGKKTLNELLSAREEINAALSAVIAGVTAPWGVRVTSVEINNVDLPEELLQDLYLATRSQRSGEADARLNESMGGITAGPDSLAAVATRDVEPKAKQEVHEQARQVAHPKIFLCYRREDTQWVARSIYENLSAKYGPKQVFRDIDSTPAGIRFSTWLEARIGQCDLMIVLIGDAWSSAKDQAGRRRLELPNDWVRQEIEASLRRRIPILPVCVQGARMPSEDELPSSIADLAGFQSTEIADSRWQFDIGRLLQAVDDLISSGDDQ
jgi:regulator of protease activity HflC (stomatin/prohibitin superfamily)